MGGDFYSILSTAEVTSGALQQTLAIIHQSTGQILRKAIKMWKTWPLWMSQHKWACSIKKQTNKHNTDKSSSWKTIKRWAHHGIGTSNNQPNVSLSKFVQLFGRKFHCELLSWQLPPLAQQLPEKQLTTRSSFLPSSYPSLSHLLLVPATDEIWEWPNPLHWPSAFLLLRSFFSDKTLQKNPFVLWKQFFILKSS